MFSKGVLLLFILGLFLNVGCQRSVITGGGSLSSGSNGACPTGPMTCINLTWNASTTPNVRYHVWYGPSSGNYTSGAIDAGPNTFYTLSGMASGTYYIAVTAYDSNGNESAYSNEVSPTLTLLDIAQKFKEEVIQENMVVIPARQ